MSLKYNKKSRRLKLEDLQVGMTVSLSEISRIYDTPIIMQSSSMDYSTGDPTGKILFIGACPAGVDTSDLVVVKNYEDEIYL